MVESNYEILNLSDDASKKEIQKAYRTLVLQHHSDRGGNDEKFKRIKQAYEDLQKGKKYPDTLDEKKSNAKFYSGTSEDEKLRKNLLLSNDVAKEMKTAEEWVAALSRTNTTGMRLFGSNELGKMEFERKPTKTLSMKGKFWAGNFKYDNSVMMWGSITNPYFSPYEKHKTHIHLTDGNFRLIDSIQNKYDIDGGAKITVDNGDMEVGNVSGKK
ncbi:MAG: J domain-containing protein, partial [Candidatus Nitrosopelagicus sp.]